MSDERRAILWLERHFGRRVLPTTEAALAEEFEEVRREAIMEAAERVDSRFWGLTDPYEGHSSIREAIVADLRSLGAEGPGRVLGGE